MLFFILLKQGKYFTPLANTEFELVEKNDRITKLINEVEFANGVDIESDAVNFSVWNE